MRTETLELDDRFGKEYVGKYVFGEISWAKRSRIIQKYTRYSKMTGQVENSDFIGIQAETVMASLREQPDSKPLSLEKLLNEEDGIPIGLGELFSQIVNRLNSLNIEESSFLSEQSEDRSQIQVSQNSGSAKSSDGHHASSENSQQKQSSNSSLSSTS